MTGRERAVLSLGSNTGSREANLERAEEAIGVGVGEIVCRSSVYESEPWGDVAGVDGCPAEGFMNRVLIVETGLEPIDLLRAVKTIESSMGRAHDEAISLWIESRGKIPACKAKEQRRYESRIIDIDIIYYGDRVLESDLLTIPHPLTGQREFVLAPLEECAPGWRHPTTGLTAGEMRRELRQTGEPKINE